MSVKNAIKATTMAAALLSPSIADAQEKPQNEVAVAIIDMGADKMYSNDPNVSFVDLTPEDTGNRRRASYQVDGRDHGELVADTFVKEYRLLDPDAKITIYSVNPFYKDGLTGPMKFSRSTIQQALPKLQEANVRIAITTFGVENEAAGKRILQDFAKADMIVFAAAPNDKGDKGIWPAASPEAISVADTTTKKSAFYKDKDWGSWVDFTSNGQFHKGTVDVVGSSYATPKVAAYGAYAARIYPNIKTDEMRVILRKDAENITAHGANFPNVSGESYSKRFLASNATQEFPRVDSKGRAPAPEAQTIVALSYKEGASR